MENQRNYDKPDWLQSKRGFTLLEMAIVLIIIAVIVGGVLVGRTLLVSSQLQAVMTDANNYIKAVDNFKQAYQALPGDFANAQGVWGTGSNGNGDGKVGPSCVNGSFVTANQFEVLQVWPQLNSANLVNNSLSGWTGSWAFVAGVNVPKGSMEGSAFSFMWLDNPSLCNNTFGLIASSGAYGNSFIFGLASANGTGTSDPVLSADQAQSIDSKFDDGVPNTGQVRSFGSATANCTVNNSGTYTYNNTLSGQSCSLIFLTNF